jgi:hypothetical protein
VLRIRARTPLGAARPCITWNLVPFGKYSPVRLNWPGATPDPLGKHTNRNAYFVSKLLLGNSTLFQQRTQCNGPGTIGKRSFRAAAGAL